MTAPTMKPEQRSPWPVILAMLGIAAGVGVIATTLTILL